MVAARHAPADEGASTVRPYAVARGRTAPSAGELPLEALVRALAPPHPGATREERTVLELTAAGYLSVAELSAHVRLPVPVVRLVVDDLVRAGSARVHAPGVGPALALPGTAAAASTRRVLQSVLDGISAL